MGKRCCTQTGARAVPHPSRVSASHAFARPVDGRADGRAVVHPVAAHDRICRTPPIRVASRKVIEMVDRDDERVDGGPPKAEVEGLENHVVRPAQHVGFRPV